MDEVAEPPRWAHQLLAQVQELKASSEHSVRKEAQPREARNTETELEKVAHISQYLFNKPASSRVFRKRQTGQWSKPRKVRHQLWSGIATFASQIPTTGTSLVSS